MSTMQTIRRATAFHEAGHTLVAAALGMPVHRVRLCCEEMDAPDLVRLGETRVEWPTIDRDMELVEAFDVRQRRIMALMAGDVAGCILSGKPQVDRENIAENVTEWAIILQLLTREAGEPLDGMGQRYWRFLEAETRRVLQQYWPMVEKVAAYLLEKGCLDVGGA